jgi:hypothetical protein
MQPIASRNVWIHLSGGQRAAVVEEIIRILTEEVENERFREDSAEPFASASRSLLETIDSQASCAAPRERGMPARVA